MFGKPKTIFIVFIVLFFLMIIGGTFFGIRTGRLEIQQELIFRKSPLGAINPKSPYYSRPLEEKEIPQGAIRIKASQEGFQPAKFKVKPGGRVILVLTSTDDNQHSLTFEAEALRKINLISEAGNTRGIVFFAPEKPGEYKFFDSQAPADQRKKE